jgi:MFS family permease
MATTNERTTPDDTRVDETGDGARPVETRTEETRTTAAADPYAGIAVAHDRFGGIDIPASIVGMLTALSTTIILAGLVGAAFGAVDYQTGLEGDAKDIATWSMVGGIAVLFVAYLIGGWAAGRMARYDGARNGFATGIWTLILGGILAGLGAWIGSEYDVFRNVDLPQWFSTEAFTTRAIISGVAAIAGMFVGAILGGIWGERYHRRADRIIVSGPARAERAER